MKYSSGIQSEDGSEDAGWRSANSVAQEVGVNQPTLSKWLRDARTLSGVTKRKSEQKPWKSAGRRPEDWSAEQKLSAVVKARGLSETELGKFLRREGLHEEQLRRRLALARQEVDNAGTFF